MKRTISIYGRDDDGRVAVLTVETDKPWQPMHAEDVYRGEFALRAIHEVQITDDLSFREILLQTTDLRTTILGKRRA